MTFWFFPLLAVSKDYLVSILGIFVFFEITHFFKNYKYDSILMDTCFLQFLF